MDDSRRSNGIWGERIPSEAIYRADSLYSVLFLYIASGIQADPLRVGLSFRDNSDWLTLVNCAWYTPSETRFPKTFPTAVHVLPSR